MGSDAERDNAGAPRRESMLERLRRRGLVRGDPTGRVPAKTVMVHATLYVVFIAAIWFLSLREQCGTEPVQWRRTPLGGMEYVPSRARESIGTLPEPPAATLEDRAEEPEEIPVVLPAAPESGSDPTGGAP